MNKIYILILTIFPGIILASGVCPDDIEVYADGPNCTATVVLPEVPWGGNCGDPDNYTVSITGQNVSYNGSSWIAYDLPVGWYTVHYNSQYPCTNNYHCTMKLKVLGGGGPTAVCDQNTVVALGNDGIGRVYAETFNDHSNSGCGSITHIEVRRMTQGWCPPGVKDDTNFGPYVEFCCEDIMSSPIQVILRVTDNNGQTNECMVLVHVQDKKKPTIYCPPDITVDCNYPIDFYNLDEFGSVVTDQSQRKPIIIDNQIVGYDGYAKDNCEVSISETHIKNTTFCGTGWVKRIFTATDWNGNTAQCIQNIYLRSQHPFNEYNIHWPDNTVVHDCNPTDLSPDVTGRPTFDDKPCSLVAATYDEDVFEFADGACMKILRYWKVIDWCQYDPYTGKGYFTHTQVIKVTDGEAPVFVDGCKDIEVCTDSVRNCKGYIDLYPEIEDCTPRDLIDWTVTIDYNNDGSIDKTVDYGDLSGFIPFGTHKIRWEAHDMCLNRSYCEKLVTVSDCKAPSPVCFGDLATVIMPSSGSIMVDADFYDRGSFDNCTPNEELIFSFSPDVTDTTEIFTCDDIGENEVDIYVTDEEGNQGQCRVTLRIQDTGGACLDSLTSHLVGRVTTEDGDGVNDVSFSITHPDYGEYIITSDEEGNYSYASYTDMSNVDSVLIMPLRADHPLNGVTSYDLFLMYKVNLGEINYDSPYQAIASDINNDGKLSSLDLIDLKRLILGQTEDFLSNISWRFVNQMESMDADDPFSFAEAQYVSLPEFNSAFTGVKIGDMNLSANSTEEADGRSGSPVSLKTEDKFVRIGEQIEIKLSVPDGLNPLSFQLYLENNEAYSIEEVTLPADKTSTYINNSYGGIVYYGGDFNQKQKEISLVIEPKVNAYLSEILRVSSEKLSLLADKNESERPITLRFNNKHVNTGFTATIIPNPVNSTAHLYINAPENQEAHIKIYSVNGMMVSDFHVHLSNGKNSIRLDDEIRNIESGVYYMRIGNTKEVVQKTFVKM